MTGTEMENSTLDQPVRDIQDSSSNNMKSQASAMSIVDMLYIHAFLSTAS